MLPKISYPLFDVTIPSSGKKIKMRPFLVKEEKILLTAQSTGEQRETILAIKQVVNNCIVDADVNVDKLATFDLEYLFVKLRARSVNNLIDVTYDDPEDEKQYKIQIDLDKVEIRNDERHSSKVKINDDLGIMLRYPKTDMLQGLETAETEVDLYFEVIKYCIDSVYDAENVYSASDTSQEDMDEFITSLDVSTFKQIQLFLETMPKLYYEASYTNSLGTERKVILQNLNDFFMLG